MSDNIVRRTARSIRRAMHKALEHTSFGHAMRTKRESRKIDQWRGSGAPIPPPPELKQRVIKQFQASHQIHTLVETGTYLGDTVEACRHYFQRIHSIELDDTLYSRAVKRFAKQSHVRIHQGDSSRILPQILLKIDEPCLFWLDAHYSAGITACGDKETPIEEELRIILNHSDHEHVVLIDDARLFLGTHDYPTIERLKKNLLRARPSWGFELADDIIRFYGNKAKAKRQAA